MSRPLANMEWNLFERLIKRFGRIKKFGHAAGSVSAGSPPDAAPDRPGLGRPAEDADGGGRKNLLISDVYFPPNKENHD